MPDTTPTTEGCCPNCNHPKHLPGTECDGGVDHGPKRWHRCLCLARPGAALSCPPQMNCQGGTLGYSDIWYLQHGHSLMTADGVVSPEALKTTQVLGTTNQQPPAPAEPCTEHPNCYTRTWERTAPTDQAAVLREAADAIDADMERFFVEWPDEPRNSPYALGKRDAANELRRLADEAQQPETEAHPTERTWAAELHDPLADEWVPGTRYLVRERAVNHLEHSRKIAPTWKDGTPTQRRLVRATTTYTVVADEQPETEAAPQCTCISTPEVDDSGQVLHGSYCMTVIGQQPDDDPICGDQYDDEACELEPGHTGAHNAGTLCWSYAP